MGDLMLAFLQTFLSFFAIVVLSAFIARKTQINAGFMPIFVMSAVMVFCVLLGYLGFLPFAVIVIFILAFAALLHMILTYKKGGFDVLLTPGFMLFCFAGLAFIAYLSIRTPIAHDWDELSMWATAAKLTKEGNAIFSSVPSGFPWPTTQKPGLPTLSYFFNFFGDFEAFRVYAAYDLLIVSVWSAAISGLKRKHWFLAVPCSIMMFLLNYLHIYTRIIFVDYTYITSYADYPMALLCVGMLAWYFNAARLYKLEKSTAEFCKLITLPLFTISMAIALCKDTGLALAFIAGAIISADLLFANKKCDETHVSNFNLKCLLPKFITIIFMFLGPILIFISSSLYLSSLGNTQGSVGGSSDMGYSAMLIEGTKQLLGMPAGASGERYVSTFNEISALMVQYFLPTQPFKLINDATKTFPGIYILIFVVALCVLCAFLCKDKLLKKSTVLYAVFSSLGFIIYYIFIGFTYVYVFKVGITDYNRYINTYYILWVGGAIVLCVLCAVQKSYFKNLLTLCVFALTFAGLYRYNSLVHPHLSFVNYPDTAYLEMHKEYDRANLIAQHTEPNTNVFYVNNTDNGYHWFLNHYALFPHNTLMYSNGGGMFADPSNFTTVSAEEYIDIGYPVISLEEFAAYLAYYECDYIFIDNAKTEFYESYGELFSDGAHAHQNGETLLYKVNIESEPIYEELTPSDVYYDYEINENGQVNTNSNYDTRLKLSNALECVSLTPVEMEMNLP